jgi:signal transduction histidine kinase
MRVPCNLTAIVSEVVEYQCRVASACTIQLLIPCEQTVLLLADPDRIEQVVTNYLTNALNYSAAERPIEIRLQVEERLACVSVRNEGGISPSEQGHIWESFYRVRSTGEQNGEAVGLGVGLYLCRTIIERHHGQVGVQSTPGDGSTFWFTLPFVGQDAPAPLPREHERGE